MEELAPDSALGKEPELASELASEGGRTWCRSRRGSSRGVGAGESELVLALALESVLGSAPKLASKGGSELASEPWQQWDFE